MDEQAILYSKKICRQLSIASAVFFILFFFWYGCAVGGQEQKKLGSLEKVLSFGTLRFVKEIKIDFDTFHVQGLEIVGEYGYVTSVNTKSSPKRGWLFKIDISDGVLVQKLDLTEGKYIHPGGLQYDGQNLLIPVAEYRRCSSTKIVAVEPESLKPVKSFYIKDHIGALACDGRGGLFGANWDTKQFYIWRGDGDEKTILDSSTSMLRYQDIKFLEGALLCCGHRGSISAIDVIDTADWKLKRRIILPEQPWLSREGMTYYNGRFYFLPDDGPDSKIFIYELKNP